MNSEIITDIADIMSRMFHSQINKVKAHECVLSFY